jgi:hypothetical protein
MTIATLGPDMSFSEVEVEDCVRGAGREDSFSD